MRNDNLSEMLLYWLFLRKQILQQTVYYFIMKEYLIDLYKKGGGLPSKTRVYAANQAAAIKIAREMNPNYKTGAIKEL